MRLSALARLALVPSLLACATPRAEIDPARPHVPPALAQAAQLVVVTTPSWEARQGTLRRFERTPGGWRAVGDTIPIVVGRTGLAWGVDAVPDAAAEPTKREGDGKSPAGIFAIGTAFGFAPKGAVRTRLPYLPLAPTTECVDDVASVHYNRVLDRRAVPRVDWTSAEKMRAIDVYRLGVVVDYNTPATAGRGSCIFLHVWNGPTSVTAGCTAMPEAMLAALVQWLDPARAPVLVQLTSDAYARRRADWRLP